jgi:spore coat polysaccharide biosynthesis protein SpsF
MMVDQRKSANVTEQEKFWAGEFGNEYTDRNSGARIVASNMALFTRILLSASKVKSVIELGANRGLNLEALRVLLPDAEFAGVEINETAVSILKKIEGVTVHHRSILNFSPAKQYELALIKGVLIHINPDRLGDAYRALYESCSRFICLAEYYNPSPVAIPYRGHSDRLFKRDFAGEMMKQYPSLRLRDYGFVYHGDPNFPQDDLTWFLMEKAAAK